MNKLFTSGQMIICVNAGSTMLQQQSLNLTDPSQLILKRGFDMVFSLFLLIFIFPWLFPFIGFMIKLTSEGPVVLKELKHGRNNIPFYCFKFRTVKVNVKADAERRLGNDRRPTRFGFLLRKSRLDKLPQVFNVIMGQMSIIGPRPYAVPMNYMFSEEIGDFMVRHAVKPGIIGLAESKGYRGKINGFLDIYSRCKLDRFYIQKWSLLLDIKIVLWAAVSLVRNKTNPYLKSSSHRMIFRDTATYHI